MADELHGTPAKIGLEPRASRPQTGLLLTRLSIALDSDPKEGRPPEGRGRGCRSTARTPCARAERGARGKYVRKQVTKRVSA
jgi:hypothetical protein